MPQPHNPAAYEDLIEGILFPALESKGKEITFASVAEAHKCQMRLFAAIRKVRRQNAAIYPPEHSMHGRSEFDRLAIQRSGNVVYVRPGTAENLEAKLGAVIKDIL